MTCDLRKGAYCSLQGDGEARAEVVACGFIANVTCAGDSDEVMHGALV